MNDDSGAITRHRSEAEDQEHGVDEVVQRRVFFGKIGTGQQLIKHMQEGNEVFQRYAPNLKTRVLSDHNSGRTDRIVAEWEMENIGEFEAANEKAMADPQVQAEFNTWVDKLNGLIHYAEVEHWHVH